MKTRSILTADDDGVLVEIPIPQIQDNQMLKNQLLIQFNKFGLTYAEISRTAIADGQKILPTYLSEYFRWKPNKKIQRYHRITLNKFLYLCLRWGVRIEIKAKGISRKAAKKTWKSVIKRSRDNYERKIHRDRPRKQFRHHSRFNDK